MAPRAPLLLAVAACFLTEFIIVTSPSNADKLAAGAAPLRAPAPIARPGTVTPARPVPLQTLSSKVPAPVALSGPQYSLAYGILQSGTDTAILFPFLPLIERIRLKQGVIYLEVPKAIAMLEDLPAAVLEALATEQGVLLVGIDALSRAVFEYRVSTVGVQDRPALFVVSADARTLAPSGNGTVTEEGVPA